MNCTTFVGFDVHKETIAVAVARAGRGDVESLGMIPNEPDAIARLMRKLGPKKSLQVAYEAGPCGYGIHRQLMKMGIECVVVAPSLVPKRPGDRVKTDRRDCTNLARLLRSGDLTPVWVPDEEHEAFRDLVRAREDMKQDVHRKKQQLIKFLLRIDVRPPQGVRRWTVKYRQWLESLKLGHSAQNVVLREYIRGLDEAVERLERIENEIAELAKINQHADVIESLMGLRGISLITAATLVAELGDINRFTSPRQVMAYAGLVPSEYSSGGKERRGAVTKTGNAHVRRVIVEAAWHYRHIPRVGVGLKKRQEHLVPELRRLSWKAQHRLNFKYRSMTRKGKPKQVAVVAVARELFGFVWAMAREGALNKTRSLQSVSIPAVGSQKRR